MADKGRPKGSIHVTDHGKPIYLKGLTLKQTSDLIKMCRQNGISSFKYGNLILEFNKKDKKELKVDPEFPIQEEKTDLEADALARKADDVDDRLDDLMTTDPVAYEQLAMEGELDDQGDSGSQPDL